MPPSTELYKKENQLKCVKENLKTLEELLPTDSVLEVNLKDYGERANLSKQYVEAGLKIAMFLPGRRNLNVNNMSVILFDRGGNKGLFLADKVPSKQNRIGLPGFLEVPGRAFYGVTWGKESPRVFSNPGNPLFTKESHEMGEDDFFAINSLYNVIADFSLVTEKDGKSGESISSLIGVRELERYPDTI